MAGYEAELVSDAEDIGIIQTRIVQNLYDKDIIVCDVSCKNANVMFELGMRLAFDKPTIIVMDNMTKYSFDAEKPIVGPFKTRAEAWKEMESVSINEYHTDIENGWNTELYVDNDAGEITIINYFDTGKDVTEFFVFEI